MLNKIKIFIIAALTSSLLSVFIAYIVLKKDTSDKYEQVWMYQEDIKEFMKLKVNFTKNDCEVSFRKNINGKHEKEVIDFMKIKTIITENETEKVYLVTLDNKFYVVNTSDNGIKRLVLLSTISNCIKLFGNEVLNEQ